MINQDEARVVCSPLLTLATFYGVASVILTAVAFAAAHAPARMKLIGLFTIALGALSGTAISLLGRRFGLGRRSVFIAAALFVPTVLCLYAAESFRTWKEARVAHVLAQPGGPIIVDQLKRGKPPANAAEAELLDAYRPFVEPKPTMYVVERLQGISPNVKQTGAALVAFGELVLGIIAGIATALFLTAPVQRSAAEVKG